MSIEIVQPLQGLGEQSVEIALKQFAPFEEFVAEEINRGVIK